MPDHDLWQIVQDLIPKPDICTLHHIKSHQSYAADEAWVQWACSANDAADQLAEFALQTLPPLVLQAQLEAKAQYVHDKLVVKHVHAHMIRVAKFAVTSKEVPTLAPARDMEDMPLIHWQNIARAAADRLPVKLKFQGVQRVLEWCQWVHADDAPIRYGSAGTSYYSAFRC